MVRTLLTYVLAGVASATVLYGGHQAFLIAAAFQGAASGEADVASTLLGVLLPNLIAEIVIITVVGGGVCFLLRRFWRPSKLLPQLRQGVAIIALVWIVGLLPDVLAGESLGMSGAREVALSAFFGGLVWGLVAWSLSPRCAQPFAPREEAAS